MDRNDFVISLNDQDFERAQHITNKFNADDFAKRFNEKHTSRNYQLISEILDDLALEYFFESIIKTPVGFSIQSSKFGNEKPEGKELKYKLTSEFEAFLITIQKIKK